MVSASFPVDGFGPFIACAERASGGRRRGNGGGNGGRRNGAGRGGGKKSGGGGSRRRWSWRRILTWAATAFVWMVILGGGVVAYYAIDLPSIDHITVQAHQPSIVMKAADGTTFATFGDLYGQPVTLKQISPYVAKAVIDTEDRRFYSHFGIDLIGMGRALVADIMAGHVVEGGSTITQQLAKNLFLTPARTIRRKVQEVLLALWLEQRFTKDQILTLYLNRVYLGAGAFGVDAAARRYFNEPASKLDLYQSALIAGLLQAPSAYNPLVHPHASRRRTDIVLQNMVNAGDITQKQADLAALTGAAELVQRPPPAGRYFADWLRTRLAAMDQVKGKDIVVKTTLDLHLQRAARRDLKRMLDGPGRRDRVHQGAVVVLSPDGAVRALVGGKDYDQSQFDRATQGLRQPGSSFKAFVYLTAMEDGYTPDSIMDDAPIRVGDWSPHNYENTYQGPVTLRKAFAQSINTVAVRVIRAVGVRNVIATAHRLGITTPLRDDASLALGTSEVTPLDMATAYAAFANGGTGVAAYGITEIDDSSGHVLYRRHGGGFGQVIPPAALAEMDDLMSAVVQDGTGRAARLDRPAAGKTGTTQDYRDAWFVGFTADYVTAVWMGNDDPHHTMRGVVGGTLPARVWKQVMTAAERGLPPRPLVVPAASTGVAAAIGNAAGQAADTAGSAVHGIGDALDNLLHSLFGK